MPAVWLEDTSSGGRRVLAWSASFAAGVVLPSLSPGHWPEILGPLVILRLLPGHRWCRLFFLPLALGAALALAHRFSDSLPELLRAWSDHDFEAGVTPVQIEGRLLDIERLSEGRLALLVGMDRFEIPGLPPFRGRPRHPVLIRLTAPVETGPVGRQPRAGERVEIVARIWPPRRFRNPGAFDYPAYLRARGIDLVGSIKSARLVRVVPGGGVSASALPARSRSHLLSLLKGVSRGEEDATTVAFLAALLVGERNDLPPDFEERLIRAGVYHIVALSGFNVALILGLFYSLMRLLPLTPRLRRLLLIPCVIAYWELARPSGSIARAALMALLCLLGASLGRRVPGIGALASSSVLILAVNPAWIRDAGFQLSFAATLGILLLTPRSRPRRDDPGPLIGPGFPGFLLRTLRGWLAVSLCVSAAALLATALVSAWHFQAFTPAALVVNLIAVPIAALLLVLGVLVCLTAAPAPLLAEGLLGLARELIHGLESITAVAAACPGGSFFVLPPPLWLVLVGQAAILLAVWGPARLRRAAILFLAMALLWTALSGRGSMSTGQLEVIVLDVGQGDAILVRFPQGTTMLIDAGGFAHSRFDVGAKVVAPALRALGFLEIDILAITHAHRDHLGGGGAVLRSFSPKSVWLGSMPPGDAAIAALEEEAERRRIPVVSPRRGVSLLLGGVRLEVLNPGRIASKEHGARNDDSLVLRLSFVRRSVLLTGDLEAAIEGELIHEDRDLRADLLKVGHHGSRTSTTGPFLLRVRPLQGVISVGARNPWGHPDLEVMRRLREEGVEVYRTDLDGAMRFTTDGLSPWRAIPLTAGKPPASSRLSTPEARRE